jgi:hypothetical protein
MVTRKYMDRNPRIGKGAELPKESGKTLGNHPLILVPKIKYIAQ